MNFVEVIARKRDGGELNAAEIGTFVRGATDGSLGDEQLAAMLMAICIRGATTAETRHLVEAMRDSGDCWRLGEAFPGCVDKHSTGGVADSVSLVFAPLVAACGVPVAMMAGAGLGHTQGTLDKLAAVPGFQTATDRAGALQRLEQCGACFAAQSTSIAPADKKLYALRDITGTVPSVPLITASIMSKKLAVGAGRLVLDVKWGAGAFCKTLEQARTLATGLATVGEAAGERVRVLVTDMNEPLGRHLGCASEVRAALDVLEGRGDERLRDLTFELSVEALVLAGRTREAAGAQLHDVLATGTARAKWDEIVSCHGGDPDPSRLAVPRRTATVTAGRAGHVVAVDSEGLGWLAVALGAGRRRAADHVDYAAGVVVHARLGDRVEAGVPLVTLELGDREVDLPALLARAAATIGISERAPARLPLVALAFGGDA
ncbi:MAG: thymidine phosphorylase [Acidobacteria bacterium]|nr:thymidine phosphorylase [Acidobacteriota bacterium]